MYNSIQLVSTDKVIAIDFHHPISINYTHLKVTCNCTFQLLGIVTYKVVPSSDEGVEVAGGKFWLLRPPADPDHLTQTYDFFYVLKNKIQWADSALIEMSSTGVAVAVQWSTKRFTTVKLKVRIPRRAFFITPLKIWRCLEASLCQNLKPRYPRGVLSKYYQGSMDLRNQARCSASGVRISRMSLVHHS